MANQTTNKSLMNYFGFTTKTNKDHLDIEPSAKSIKDFPSEILQLWKWYLSETADTFETLRNRKERYADSDYMEKNEPIISMALDLYADEVSQTDDKFQLFKIRAKNPKVVEEIKELFKRLSINQAYIRECARNLCQYGDSFDLIDSNPKDGITSLTPISVYDVTDRLEFKASEIEKKLRSIRFYKNCRSNSINQYIKDLIEKGNMSPSAAYVSYLFGFVLGENHYLAPWQVLHYRLNSRHSEFFPFGRPLFVNLIGPFRQLKTSMNFLAIARTKKFPKEVFKVKTSDEMTGPEKWEAVNEAKQQYHNSGFKSRNKDEFALGEEIWLPDEVLEYESVSTNISLDDIADIEMLRDNLIMGTAVPKGYLITNESNWGTSSQSLLQQSKPFARAGYRIQSEIMDRLSFLIRLHFLITGKFEKEFTEFEIEMNFPVIEEAEDRIRAKKDSLDFAKDLIDSLKELIGYSGDAVPAELVKQVLSKFSFLDSSEINDYLKMLKNAQDSDGEQNTEEDNQFRFNEHYGNRITEESIMESYFDVCRKSGITECCIYGKHSFIPSQISKSDNDIFEMMRNVNRSIKDKFTEEEEILK